MASKIEWTDVTWNPVVGCAHVSPGCDNCYAAREASGRLRGTAAYAGLAEGGRFSGEARCLPERLDQPLHWRKPRFVFVNSMSDLFHPDVPMDFILRVWSTMSRSPQHTFQVLTKRPQRMAKIVDAIAWKWEGDLDGGGEMPLPGVWLGTSIENDRYTFRADHLRATPAAVRFLSLEPLLGPLPSLDLTGIDWVIVGGESGPRARPMHPDWARSIRDRCVDAGVPFFFKQWGEWEPVEPVYGEDGHDDVLIDDYEDVAIESLDRAGQVEMRLTKAGGTYGHQPDPAGNPWWMARVGKKAAGRVLDGRTWGEMPAVAPLNGELPRPEAKP